MTGDGPQEGATEQGSVKPQAGFRKADFSNSKFVNKFHPNTSSDLILITEDKALICLMKNYNRLKERDAWKVPAGILATLLTVMVTAAPQEKFGLSKDAWTAIGVVSTVATVAWLVRDLFRFWSGQRVDPQSIVNQLKTITATGPIGGS